MTKASKIATLISQAQAITTVQAMCDWIDGLTISEANAIDKFLSTNDMVESDLFPNLPA